MPAPRPQNASPRFHSAPMAPAAAHRQASRGPRGPRAAKCVTTHFCRVSLAAPPSAPRDFGLPEAARSRQEPPRAARGPRAPALAPRKTRISCGPHAFLRPRPLAHPQAPCTPRAFPKQIARIQGESPKPFEKPAPLRASRGEGQPASLEGLARQGSGPKGPQPNGAWGPSWPPPWSVPLRSGWAALRESLSI